MAQHDYVIANQSGSAFRADLNNALAASVSTNSGSSAPSSTTAYMLWADTTNGILKIRNSANNAWVELLQLDGTLTMEDGTESSPGLGFRDDLDTGLYSPSSNVIAISTGATQRLQLSSGGTVFNESGADVDFRIEGDSEANLFYVDAGNDRIGIGTNAPSETLDVEGAIECLNELRSKTGNDLKLNAGSVNRDVYLQVNDVTLMTVKGSTGNFEIADGNLVVANFHGIDFGASEGGTGTSSEVSLLDDYESGTWTGGLTVGTATHLENKYIKVGKLVHFWGRIRNPTDVSSSADLTITGLPFSVTAGSAVGSAFGKEVNSTGATTTYVTTSEQVQIYGMNAGNAWTNVKYNDLLASIVCEIYYTGSYYTEA